MHSTKQYLHLLKLMDIVALVTLNCQVKPFILWKSMLKIFHLFLGQYFLSFQSIGTFFQNLILKLSRKTLKLTKSEIPISILCPIQLIWIKKMQILTFTYKYSNAITVLDVYLPVLTRQ